MTTSRAGRTLGSLVVSAALALVGGVLVLVTNSRAGVILLVAGVVGVVIRAIALFAGRR
jgi:hypothetical protein